MDRVDDGVDGDTPYPIMTTRAPASKKSVSIW